MEQKLSFYAHLNETLLERGPEGTAAYARELGFSGIEAYPGPGLSTIEEAKALKTAMGKEGLTASCLSICVHLFGEKADEHVEYLKFLADMACELGAPYLHHTLAPGAEPISTDDPRFAQIFDDVAEHAGRVADYCAESGLTCLYEDQGMLFNDPENIEMMLKALNRKNTGICADFGNIIEVDRTPQEFISHFAGRIRNVHIKDFLWKSGKSPFPGQGWIKTRAGDYVRETVPGHGVIDIVDCMKLILQSGYDGWYGFEFNGPESFDWGVKAAMENVRRYFELAKAEL